MSDETKDVSAETTGAEDAKKEAGKIKKGELSVLLGAAFLMATSAIGPGFLTQTAKFTGDLAKDFGFVILISLIFALIAQLNIWRVIAVSGLRAQDIANKLLKGLGYLIAFMVAFGGLVFNIGNVGGGAIGLRNIFGLPDQWGAAITGIIGILIFVSKKAGSVMDILTQVLGGVMIVLILVVAIYMKAPVGAAVQGTFAPSSIATAGLWIAVLTLIGGTVGGYIPFSGGHRLIDAGITGPENLGKVTKSAVTGIVVAAVVRVLLFLAALAVVSAGLALNPDDPAGSVFTQSLGRVGAVIFGIVIFAAALSSVVGAAYTSVSFLKTLFAPIGKYDRLTTILFIAVSTLIMVFVGNPAVILVAAGTINGFILPFTLAIILIASLKKSIVKDYKHSKVLMVLGWIVVVLTLFMSVRALVALF